MSNLTRIHKDKTPDRIHYIVEWAAHREMTQADIARETGADKSLVSRWFSGKLPKPEYLASLAAAFHTDIQGLFRHPDDDWLSRFFRNKTEEQKEQAIAMLKVLFPNAKTGTDD